MKKRKSLKQKKTEKKIKILLLGLILSIAIIKVSHPTAEAVDTKSGQTPVEATGWDLGQSIHTRQNDVYLTPTITPTQKSQKNGNNTTKEFKVRVYDPQHSDILKLSKRATTHCNQSPIVCEKLKKTFNDQKIIELVSHESSLNTHAVNRSSGACGLFQSNPCNKMGCNLDNIDCQIEWGKQYINKRYGSVDKAWQFWQQHGWY